MQKMSSQGYIVKASSLTRIYRRRIYTSGNNSNADYEIDLITLRKRAKNKDVKPQTDARHSQDEIINLSIPHSSKEEHVKEDADKTIYELKKNLESLEVSINKKFNELEGVLRVISNENKQTNSELLNQWKQSTNQKPKKSNEEIDMSDSKDTPKATIHVNRKDLESFLQHAKQNKDRQEAEYFRVVRAMETSIPRSRSLEQKNFFTPVNENLIQKLSKRGTFPTLETQTEQDELLFPTIPKHDENNIHEFLILSPNDSTPIITQTSPLQAGYHKPDLVSMIQKLGTHHDSYWKKILKYEKQKWTLIATEGYEDQSVLIFERIISKDDLKKMERKKWNNILIGTSVVGAILYSLGYYLEQDESKPLIKKTIQN